MSAPVVTEAETDDALIRAENAVQMAECGATTEAKQTGPGEGGRDATIVENSVGQVIGDLAEDLGLHHRRRTILS